MKVLVNKHTYHLPESWAEVRQADIPAFIRCISQPASGDTYLEAIRIALGITQKKWSKFIDRHFNTSHAGLIDVNARELHKLLHIISWLWRVPLNVKPFEHIEVSGVRYMLPDPSLDYVSWGELIDAVIHYELFTSQAEIDSLYMLVATICRPARSLRERKSPNWNGDPRITYNPFVAKQNSQLFRNVPEDILLSTVIYFGGIFSNLYSKFDLSTDGEPATEEYPGQNLLKNSYNLAEKQIFGNMQNTRNTNCYEILNFLEEHKKDIQKQIEEIEAQKNQNS